MELPIPTLDVLEKEASRFVEKLRRSDTRATLVTLAGELGAGKTAFTKLVAHALGVEEVVNSPTFVLEKIYALPQNQPFKHLVHIDAYRLTGGEELQSIGFDEIMRDPENLVMLEWPERVHTRLPTPDHSLIFIVHADQTRTLIHE